MERVKRTGVNKMKTAKAGKPKQATANCMLCRCAYPVTLAHQHMQGLNHHKNLEKINGSEFAHECQACDATYVGIAKYLHHINTIQHKDKHMKLVASTKRPFPVQKYLDAAAINHIKNRNKNLRKKAKKEKNKKRKNELQQATAEKRRKTVQQQNPRPKTARQENTSIQPTKAVSKQPQQNVQNKENRLAKRPGWLPPGQPATPQQQGPAPHQPTPHRRPVGYSNGSGTAKDFNGVSKHTAAQGSGEGRNEGTGPIRGEDVQKMLSNVQKALQTDKGTSRVETNREARGTRVQFSQQGSASNLVSAHGVRLSKQADKSTQGRTLVKKVTGGILSADALFDDSHGPLSRDEESQEEPSALKPGSTLVLPASLSRHMNKTAPQAGPNLNTARRVRRVARASRKAEGEKEAGLKPTLQKLLSSTGSQRKVNWKEMYQEADRKKQEKIKGMPRFGIEMVSSSGAEPDGIPMDDDNVPLTEGFQWESPHLDRLPAAPQPQTAPAPETPSDGPVPGSERPQVAPRKKKTTEPSTPVRVKKEPNRDGELDSPQSPRKVKKKRKAVRPGEELEDSEIPGVSGLNPGGKKSKNDQVQVDQLLAVSLKEEELSISMQTVDHSLIQARNALQAAYTEVQRLLCVKQQVTDEINSLRAKRIEILQGMQGQTPLLPALPTPQISSTTPPPPLLSALLPSLPALSTSPSPPIPALTTLLPTLPPFQPSSPSVANPNTHQPAAILPNQAIKQEVVYPHSQSSLSQQHPRIGHSPSQPAQVQLTTTAPTPSTSSNPAAPLSSQQRVKLEARSKMSDSSSTASDSSDSEDDADCSIKRVGTATVTSSEVVEIVDSDSDGSPGVDSSHQHPGPPPDPLQSASVEAGSSVNPAVVSLTQTKGVKVKKEPDARAADVPAEEEEEAEPSLGSFMAHTGPVHALQIHRGLLYTCSEDNTARAYSLVTKECQAEFVGHTNKINCLLVSSPPGMPARLYTGSSDETVRCYSLKSYKCLEQITLPDRVLCLHIAWNILYVGLANGFVVSFDLKTQRQLDVSECHTPRGVSCLGSAQEGARRVLLVGSYDSTISVRDAKSYLLLRTLQGHTKTVLCSKVVNDLVFSGSSDTSVHAHNIHTGELVRIYKGHTHAVTAVAILGKVMVTACLDKLVRVYELQSHDRLQVYGGHSAMVMCMAVHKSVIYTGCYDGTVQAVKLNLMENYRCWWHGCSFIFGVKDHLLRHLLDDHKTSTQKTCRCRWKDCEAFFGVKNMQELPGHMQTHVEKHSELQP